MGGMWANEAWGRFWGCDPKETWALITWVVYAGYLHTRITLGWAGKRPAAIAVFAFAVVVFTFMGVNLGLTGEGLHTYGSGLPRPPKAAQGLRSRWFRAQLRSCGSSRSRCAWPSRRR